ncbi:MAG: 2-oxoacid:ferredoxin oxidoreductase subunit beta [Candidatus Dojkabacteria bacterium]
MGSDCQNCVKHKEFRTDQLFTWCTGCGNYGIFGAMRNALVELNLPPHELLMVFDIGCNGNGADKIEGYRYKSLHGRSLPFAAGASVANNKVKVIASAGDGAVLAEGLNHLIHAVRNNYNLTFIIHNNSNFALTTGQASPTTPQNQHMNASPDGATGDSLNILNLLLPLDPSFVARGFSGNIKQLTGILKEAIQHEGLSIVEILQACPSYSEVTTHEWFLERVYDLSQKKGYDKTNLNMAIETARDLEHKIATGVIYTNPWKLPFNKRLANRVETFSQLNEEVLPFDISPMVGAFL